MDKIYDFEDDSEDETVTRQGVRYNNVEQTKPDDENILPGGSADQGIIDYEGYDSDKDREYVPSTSDAESAETDEREDVYENYIDENAGQIDQIGDANTAEVDRNRSPKILKRKRQRNPASWKCNQRKAARAAGKEYVSIRNKVVPAKRLRIAKDCQTRCLYNCQKLITEDERTNIFERYYTLPEHGKKLFLLSTTKKCDVERHRKNKNDVNSRRKHTYNYYFRVGNTEIPVCKVFYLSTLNISQTPVYTAHSKKDISNIPDVPLQGKHTKYSVPLEDVNFVKTHIESFPKVNSHYCRANTQRLYLEPSLNIKKMYTLYEELCVTSGKQPVKESFYRTIFCNEYNLHFHIPRKDRCDLCEEVKLNKKEDALTAEKKNEYETHVNEKNAAREEKNKDRESATTVYLVFDLQNVLSCPHAEISNFYYKSKLNVYHFTAILSSTKQVYSCLWNEMLLGRGGNDIASALVKILDAVFRDNPDLNSLVLWCDSCVPQNRNSFISVAIALFLHDHQNIDSITVKYSTPGHSCAQEIDAVHSKIERVLNKSEYYSPVSLLRLLLKVSPRKPFKIIQLSEVDFKDFKSCASKYNYKIVPFTKVTALRFSKSFFEIEFKISHQHDNWTKVSIRNYPSTRSEITTKNDPIQPLTRSSFTKIISDKKIAAIKSMYKWMPAMDRAYFEAIFPKR